MADRRFLMPRLFSMVQGATGPKCSWKQVPSEIEAHQLRWSWSIKVLTLGLR